MRKNFPSISLVAFAIAFVVHASTARAESIAACGDQDIDAHAHCEIVQDGECASACTPTSFEQACLTSCGDTEDLACSADCEAYLKEACNARCLSPDGALFCDGQYVDPGGKLQDCIDALDAFLATPVDQPPEPSSCAGGGCEAVVDAGWEASADPEGGSQSASGTDSDGGCSVPAGKGSDAGMASLLMMAGLWVARRVRHQGTRHPLL